MYLCLYTNRCVYKYKINIVPSSSQPFVRFLSHGSTTCPRATASFFSSSLYICSIPKKLRRHRFQQQQQQRAKFIYRLNSATLLPVCTYTHHLYIILPYFHLPAFLFYFSFLFSYIYIFLLWSRRAHVKRSRAIPVSLMKVISIRCRCTAHNWFRLKPFEQNEPNIYNTLCLCTREG